MKVEIIYKITVENYFIKYNQMEYKWAYKEQQVWVFGAQGEDLNLAKESLLGFNNIIDKTFFTTCIHYYVVIYLNV